MFSRNIDFFAVLLIALAVLGLAEARSWNSAEALDSFQVENAIHIERCPIPEQILSTFSWFLHR